MNIILKNSKEFLIHDYSKDNSLKQKHFSNFLNNISNGPYYNLITDKRIQEIRKLKIKDVNRNYKNHKEIKKENTSPEFAKFKKPKSINYNSRFKATQYRNNNKKSKSKQSNIFNYKTYLNNESKYDPSKISNNYLNFFKEIETSKLSPTPKKEKLKLKIINNTKNKNRKDKKDNNKYEVREGYFGRKDKMGIPYLFDTSTIFYNKYYNKSEKKRHENILNELYKLKGFLVGDISLQISTFKDFLNKYNIKNLDQFSDGKIISICNILKNKDKNFLISFLKPYLCNKDMILDFFNTISSIKETDNMDKNNNNIEMESINYNFDNDNKIKLFIKQNSDSQILNNKNDDLFKTKINKNNKKENRKGSRNIIINITNNLSDKINNTNSKDCFSKTDNSFFNKNSMIVYQSPFFIPHKRHYISSSKKRTNDNFPKKKLELSDTNSLLKKLSYQTKALGPTKEYSTNNDLIISDISKEIRDLKNKYNRVLITGKIYNLNEEKEKNKTQTRFYFSKNKLQKELYLFKKKVLSHSPSVTNKYPKLYSKDFFSKTSIQFYNNNVNIKEQNENNRNKKINLQIISLKNENFEKLKKCSSNTQPIYEKIIKNKDKSLNERNIRMYYKPIKYQFGYKQVKDMHKLTECAALTFAKKKKYDPLGLLCNI